MWLLLTAALLRAGEVRAEDGLPPLPLTCTLKTVQAGQFRGLQFAGGPAGGTTMLTVAASAIDRRLGRVAIVETDRAGVAEVAASPQQVVLTGHDDPATILLSLFTAQAHDGTIPAAMSRQELIGSIPVIVQSAGTCRAP